MAGADTPVRQSWGEGTRRRTTELEALWRGMLGGGQRASDLAYLDEATRRHLAAARNAAELLNRPGWRLRDGPLLECAISNLDAVEAHLLQIASPDYLLGQLPGVLNQAQRHLTQDDPRRRDLEVIVRDVTGQVTVVDPSAGARPERPPTDEVKTEGAATAADASPPVPPVPPVPHTRPRSP